MGKCLYGVYDTKNNDELVFCGSSKEVAEYFNTSVKTIYCAASRKAKRAWRYEIVNIGRLEDE